MILGQLEMGEHQTKCRALVHIIVIIVISITMTMEILVIDIVIITSSKARATFPCAEPSELSCVHSVHNRPFGFPVLLYTQSLHPAVPAVFHPIDHKYLRLNKCLNLAEVTVDVDHQDPLAPDHSLQSGSSTQDVFGSKSPVVKSP